MNRWIREDLQEYKPYKPNEVPHSYKMNANESPFKLPESVKEDIISWIKNSENLNIYPSTNCDELRQCIGELFGLDSDNVVCGVGSDEIIDCITKAFLNVNDTVVFPIPTFYMYEMSTIVNRGKTVKVSLNKDFSLDEDKFIKAVKDNDGKLVFLCTPNNPTGGVLKIQQLKKILESVTCPVVIDEAYGEFTEESMTGLIKKYDNIIVLKTFSKSYGLAGARIGYALAQKELIEAINIVKPPYNVSTISQLLATYAIKNNEKYIERINYLKNEREYLLKELKKINKIKVLQSETNFIYLISDLPIYESCLKEGILVREYASEIGANLRITVGKHEENEKLIKIIQSL